MGISAEVMVGGLEEWTEIGDPCVEKDSPATRELGSGAEGREVGPREGAGPEREGIKNS